MEVGRDVLGFPAGASVSWLFLFLSTFAVAIVSTRFLTGRAASSRRSKPNVVPSLPYWIPGLGHMIDFVWDPTALFEQARDGAAHGIFSLRLGPSTHNIISNPDLVKNVMQQKESVVSFQPIAWFVMERFFGVPKYLKEKYFRHWEELNAATSNALMREPHLGNALRTTIGGLEENIPNMITFMDSVIDQQPWEKSSDCKLTPGNRTEVEINFLSLVRDMMGNVSIPAIYNQGFMDNNPTILQDLYALDAGMKWLMSGLPRWVPIPALLRAHIAQKRVRNSITAFHEVYDDFLDGKPMDPAYGELDDVGELIRQRTVSFREYGFAPSERADISVLWALVVNANVCVYWMLMHILATPNLADRIRSEIEGHVRIDKPFSINGISEAPKMTIAHEGLSKNCPLLRASFFETNRLCNQPWSVRSVEKDVRISNKSSRKADTQSFDLKAGEYITVPHDLHMLDGHYFEDPKSFKPERFMERDPEGNITVNTRTIRPFGGGPSQCKGRVYAERECLSLVAGILAMYNIEPADSKGWIIPDQVKATAISLPKHDTRVKITRRDKW